MRTRGYRSASVRSVAGLIAVVAMLVLLFPGCSPAPQDAGTEGVDDPGTDGSEGLTRNSEQHDSRQRVWLDVDTAIGLPQGEVDDGVMLLQAFNSPELELLGVSVVFGNTKLDQAVPIAEDMVSRFGPEGLAVFRGANGAADLGKMTPAVEAMAAALREGPLMLLSVGPVTNTATLLQLHPELHSAIESIVMVAGRRPGQEFRVNDDHVPFQDFNFELDPAAMQVILDSEIELVLAPWEVSSHVWLRQADLDDLAAASETGSWLAKACETWVARWKDNMGVDGFTPFDTLAVGWVTHPQSLQSFVGGAWIEEGPDDRNAGETKPYLLVDENRGDERQVRYTYLPDDSFQPMLLERLRGQSLGGQR